MAHISLVALVVDDYDRAIDFYCNAVGFTLVEDTIQSPTKRWVVVAPNGDDGTALLLAQASSAEQCAHVGNQTGGRVGFFLDTDDFAGDHARMIANGVHFREEPRHESYGIVAVFEDLYGNAWDLLQRLSPAGTVSIAVAAPHR